MFEVELNDVGELVSSWRYEAPMRIKQKAHT